MVRSLKMDQAKQLLINSSMTIKEIANLIGYSSAANFTTSFTHVVGMSPKTYRTHMTQNGERMSEVTSSPKTEPR
jgi:AraC-like DNA-binding protein